MTKIISTSFPFYKISEFLVAGERFIYGALSLAVDDLKFEGSLYDFSRLLSTSLTEKVWLRDLASQFNLDDEDTDKDVTKYGVVGTLF